VFLLDAIANLAGAGSKSRAKNQTAVRGRASQGFARISRANPPDGCGGTPKNRRSGLDENVAIWRGPTRLCLTPSLLGSDALVGFAEQREQRDGIDPRTPGPKRPVEVWPGHAASRANGAHNLTGSHYLILTHIEP